MPDTICLLIYLPYQRQKTLVKVPACCTAGILMEKLEEMYGKEEVGLKASYLYFPEQKRLLLDEVSLDDQGIDSGAVLYWV